MEKIIVLGTGTASAINNTCFVLEDNNNEYLLVDTGGKCNLKTI